MNFGRHLALGGNTTLLASLFLCFVNTFVLFSMTKSPQEAHRQIANEVKRDDPPPIQVEDDDDFKLEFKPDYHHWNISRNEDKYKISFEGDFDWEVEFSRLMSVVPALFIETNNPRNKTENYHLTFWKDDWRKAERVGEVLPSISRKMDVNKITKEFRKIKKLNSEVKSNANTWPEYQILDCKEMKEAENSPQYPKLAYVSRSVTRWAGRLELSKEHSIQIVQKRFTDDGKASKFVGGREGENGEFELGKRELYNLLAVQGWYGMPKVYAVCIMNENFEDITQNQLNVKYAQDKAYIIRYVISDFDENNSLQFCQPNDTPEACMQLKKLYYRLRSRERPPVVTLQVMFNIANLFYNLEKRNAYIDGILGHEIVMTPDFNVYLTGVSSLVIVPQDGYNLHSNSTKMLSGTICMRRVDCPATTWLASNFGSAIGGSCSEIGGMCSSVGLCWGVDINSYACVISRWIFSALKNLVPPKWPLKMNMLRLIDCGSEPLYGNRCTWLKLKDGFKRLLLNATGTWP